MAWTIELTETARKQLRKIDKQAQETIRNFLKNRVAEREEPRDYGAPLRGSLSGLWKYRVGDYRIIAEIKDQEIVVLVVRIGHRSKIYGGH